MVVGHTGKCGTVVLWHVAVDLKIDRDHVLILLHDMFVAIAKERRLSPSHATQTVVQVTEMPFKPQR